MISKSSVFVTAVVAFSTFLIGVLPVLSQQANSIYEPWGLGVLSIEDGKNKSEILNFSQDTIQVYDAPGGEILGIVYPDTRMQRYYHVTFSYDTALTRPIALDPTDAIAINYEGTCLRLFDSSDGYVEILRTTLGSVGRCWAKVSDLREKGLEPLPWVEFFLSLNQYRTFYNRSVNGINIRSAPSVDSSLVMTLTNTGLRIMLTGQRSGGWLQVSISDRYLEPGIDTSKVEWTGGWLKVVDEKGLPQFWYYPKGC